MEKSTGDLPALQRALAKTRAAQLALELPQEPAKTLGPRLEKYQGKATDLQQGMFVALARLAAEVVPDRTSLAHLSDLERASLPSRHVRFLRVVRLVRFAYERLPGPDLQECLAFLEAVCLRSRQQEWSRRQLELPLYQEPDQT
jgi:hypothetical protein